MTFEIEPIVAEKYTAEQVDAALLALAVNGGQYRKTVREIAAGGGPKIPESTLKGWRESYPQRYGFHLTANTDKAEKAATQGFLEIIHATQAAMLEAVELEAKRIQRGDVRDAASSGRNLATIAGISGTQLLQLSGRPTQVVEHRKPEEVLRRLAALGVVESTAVEEPSPSASLPE